MGLAHHVLPHLIEPWTGWRPPPPQGMEKGVGGEQDRESAWALPAHCRLLSKALTSLDLSLPTWSKKTMDLMAVQASSQCLPR